MLLELAVKNVALNAEARMEFQPGLTCITGETGAGKSLTVDALGLALGGRADAALIKEGAERAEAAALFAISPELKARLKELDLSAENEDELILRRVLSRDGKNKAYINGHLSTITLLKEIAGSLVSIHGQHASYKLLDPDYQLSLIDGFGGYAELAAEVSERYRVYAGLRSELTALSQAQKEGALRYKSLRYDLEILTKLNLKEGDYEELSERFDKSMHAAKIAAAAALAQGVLDSDEHNVIEILSARADDLSEVLQFEPRLQPIIDALNAALTELDSARTDLSALSESFSVDDSAGLNEKLALCHDAARRFGVEPRDLYKLQADLEHELTDFLSLRQKIEDSTAQVKAARAQYEEAAAKLSEARVKAAQDLSVKVQDLIRTLAMPDGRFVVKVTVQEGIKPRAQGRDEAEFLFSANLGQDLKSLGTAASGGELSRLALALEAITASARSTPTIIFDEVDTGISGRTASAVGAVLKQLSRSVQVLTVTHLPQVAAAADAQFLAVKENTPQGAVSRIEPLDRRGRIEELARMMSGAVVTEATRQSAAALLDKTHD